MKKILYIIFSSIIVFITIFLILFIFEKIYSLSDEVKWKEEDQKINNMNYEKLSNIDWEGNDLIWLYKDQKLEPKKEKKRILIVGDSVLWGHGYSNANLIWWQQLRNQLLRLGYNDVEIYALCRAGYNTIQQHKALIKNDIMNNLNPDLIIFTYVENDTEAWQNPYDDNEIWKYSDYGNHEPLELIFGNSVSSFFNKFYPNLSSKINTLLLDKYTPKYGFGWNDYMNQIVSEEFLEKYKENALIPLKKYLDNYDVPYFVVAMPNDWDKQVERNKKIQNVFVSAGFKFYNLDDEFLKETQKKYFFEKNYSHNTLYKINPANGHIGTKITDFLARQVSNILINEYPNVLGNISEVEMNDVIINDPMPRNINLKKISENEFTFIYPSSKNKLLSMPIREDYVKLNFMYPIDINSIEVTGDNIKNANLYINKIDEFLGYDTQNFYKIEGTNSFIVNKNSVTSINIHIDFKENTNSLIKIRIIKE